LKNTEVADLLLKMSQMSEAAGEDRFKSIAYRRAATTIRNLDEDIEKVWRSGRLTELKYVGEAIARKLDEYLRTGNSTFLEKMKEKVPPGAMQLMEVPGIGPRTAYRLSKELGVRSVQELQKRLESGQLDGELGLSTSRKILEEVRKMQSAEKRMLIPEAEALVEEISRDFKAAGIDIIIAGSLRRRRSTVGDIDLISVSESSGDVLAGMSSVRTLIEKGPKSVSVRLQSGAQVDLRVFRQEELGAALMYFTGSKEHNIALRNLAISKGLKLNEYGLFDSKQRRLAAKTEAEVFAALGLEFIPPELRENRGEIEAARYNRLPKLVELDDMKADLQVHSTWSDGEADLSTMAKTAKSIGYDFMAITDHSQSMAVANGLSQERFRRQWLEVDRLNDELAPFRVLKGVELEVRGDGSLDFDAEFLKQFDIVGASIHQGYRQSPDKLTARALAALRSPHVDFLCHPTNRLIGRREGHKLDMPRVIKAAVNNGKMLEIDGQPNRLDLDEVWARRAAEEGVKLLVNSDAHSEGELLNIRYGITVARRAWLSKENVANALTLKKFRSLLS
jgi:DNA polymerase (family 10)